MAASLPDCPRGWEYTDIAGADDSLRLRAQVVLRWIRLRNVDDKQAAVRDTRGLHAVYFKDLTPQHFPYFAGHYRGEPLRCLDVYEVTIRSDPSVGHPAATVPLEMRDFQAIAMTSMSQMSFTWSVNAQFLSREEKLLQVTDIIAGLFVYFLEIHPYANGNGHMARFICLALYGLFDIYPARWPVHPRPQDPPYSDAIKRYRRGDRQPLISFLLACL